MSRTLTLSIAVTDDEFASLIARFADRAVLNADGGTIAAPIDDDDDDTTVSNEPTGLDSAGVPWIDGVHSSSKKKNNDGTWRLMKGVDKDKASAAIAAAKQATLPVAPSFTPPTAVAPVELPAATPPVQPVYSAPVGLPGMPAATPAPVPAPVVDVPVSYAQVIEKAQELATKNVTNETFAAIYAAAGVTDVNALVNDETLRRKLMDELNKVAV